jgi:hypothetical protein
MGIVNGWSDTSLQFHAPPPHPGGDLGTWSGAANHLFAAGCEAQGFALLCSFAAPLMSLFHTGEGGAVVALHGGRRSGKSVTVAACASVWGLPADLDLARGGHDWFASLRHLPVLATTLANRDPLVGGLLLRDFLRGGGGRWSTILISIGGEKLAGSDIIELDLKVPRGLIVPDKQVPSVLEQKLLNNRGAAGAAYLRELVTPETVKWCRKMLASKYALIKDELGLGAEWRFQMRAIAAAWIVGELCVRARILECSPERIARWAMGKALPQRKAAE